MTDSANRTKGKAEGIKKDTREKVEAALEDENDVREKIRDFTVRTISSRKLSFSELGNLTEEIFQASVQAIEKQPGYKAEQKLGQVYEGVTDALEATMKATRMSAENAIHRGAGFAESELKKTRESIDRLETEIVQALNRVAEKSDEAFQRPISTIIESISSRGSRLKLFVEDTLSCLTRKPLTTAGVAAGTLLQGMSGLLLAAADTLSGKKQENSEADDDTEASSSENT